MSVKIIDRDNVTEKEMEDAVLDFTYGVLQTVEMLDAKEQFESGPVAIEGGKAGILASKNRGILTLQRTDPEEEEAMFPLYKYDLEDDELLFFDTRENRYYEPCFEVYAEIQFWDYQFSRGLL